MPVFVAGGVVPSIGQGSVAASLGRLIHWRGYGGSCLKRKAALEFPRP